MAWTEERVENLKVWWRDGLSASQIAGRLGDVTRNSVIGKVHRLGLSGRQSKCGTEGAGQRRTRPTTRYARPSRPIAQPAPTPDPVPAVTVDLGPGDPVKFAGLKPHHCRYPHGDPRESDFVFCGRRKPDGKSYCEIHDRIAHGGGRS